MIPNDKGLDRKDDSEQPLENQQLDSLEEDRELEHRKRNLGARSKRIQPKSKDDRFASSRSLLSG